MLPNRTASLALVCVLLALLILLVALVYLFSKVLATLRSLKKFKLHLDEHQRQLNDQLDELEIEQEELEERLRPWRLALFGLNHPLTKTLLAYLLKSRLRRD